MSTVLAVISGTALIVVTTAASVVVAFGLVAALFGSPLTSPPPVERSITTQAEGCRCVCTRREP